MSIQNFKHFDVGISAALIYLWIVFVSSVSQDLITPLLHVLRLCLMKGIDGDCIKRYDNFHEWFFLARVQTIEGNVHHRTTEDDNIADLLTCSPDPEFAFNSFPFVGNQYSALR